VLLLFLSKVAVVFDSAIPEGHEIWHFLFIDPLVATEPFIIFIGILVLDYNFVVIEGLFVDGFVFGIYIFN